MRSCSRASGNTRGSRTKIDREGAFADPPLLRSAMLSLAAIAIASWSGPGVEGSRRWLRLEGHSSVSYERYRLIWRVLFVFDSMM